MIYHIDRYFDDIQDLLEFLTEYSNDPETWAEFKENYPNGITITECKEIPLVQFTERSIIDALMEQVQEEYWPENSDGLERDLNKVIKDNLTFDLEKLNKAIPTVWMTTKEKTHYSLEELEGML